jgi:hypothetical protein
MNKLMRSRKLRGFPAKSHIFWPLCGHSGRSEKPSALRSLLPVRPVFRPRIAFPWSDPYR